MNGRIVSDVDPNNWPKILALFMAEPTISRADKNRLEAEAINFTSSAPLTLQAMYAEMAAMVYILEDGPPVVQGFNGTSPDRLVARARFQLP